ncbi:hypothetical protein GL2_10330 [Microbulbifer sp. GL-2]|nr:hypothetical protein GL2_10330 [Microbulbifer sp. GL-2]
MASLEKPEFIILLLPLYNTAAAKQSPDHIEITNEFGVKTIPILLRGATAKKVKQRKKVD